MLNFLAKETVLQIRPKNRPVKLYCRVCAEYHPDKGWTRGGVPTSPAADITKTECGICGTVGSLVFHEVTKEIKKWAPVCGNANCDGTCTNLLCIPPEESAKSEVKKIAIYNNKLVIFSFGLLIGYVLSTLHIIPI